MSNRKPAATTNMVTPAITSGHGAAGAATLAIEEDENDRTNISQLYNLNTISSRILDDTNEGGVSAAPWMGLAASAGAGPSN